MAKSAMSLLRTLPRPFGEVEPTIARPGVPLALMTAAKSLAIRLALASPGSARTVKSLGRPCCGSGASASAGLASAARRAIDGRTCPGCPARPHATKFACHFYRRGGCKAPCRRGFFGIGGQIPARQQPSRRRTRRLRRRRRAAALAQASGNQNTKILGARPDAFRSSSVVTLASKCDLIKAIKTSLPCGIAGKMAKLRGVCGASMTPRQRR